eukprot:CAMPEP_0205915438 /NCGR_PEP_ID=MMETSP1325-20131115/7869_1 /ASSEMBLY_ACC=CAM_ASM_000708 /TAXON_ID=236786 /ORGANISM="Florenciella sp., Strain RCC1007" /LENGTH=555 /DNA_ID=CAMNT_0053282611 /DNA_START=1 /DNA_END=1669 /DNA_ORIENTATION=+
MDKENSGELSSGSGVSADLTSLAAHEAKYDMPPSVIQQHDESENGHASLPSARNDGAARAASRILVLLAMTAMVAAAPAPQPGAPPAHDRAALAPEAPVATRTTATGHSKTKPSKETHNKNSPKKKMKASKTSASDATDTRGAEEEEEEEEEEEGNEGADTKDVDSEQAKILNRRMRNRKHAAATRRRKKESMNAMLEELDQLRKDKMKWATAEERERQIKLRRRTWVDCTHRAFSLQTNYNSNPAAWASCFDPNVVLVQPVTPYRSCDTSRLDPTTSRCELVGIPALMKNAVSLVVALGALANRGLHHERPETAETGGLRLPCDVALSYQLSTGEVGSDVVGYRDDGLMCSFRLMSRNLTRLGLLQEVAKCGTVSVHFNAIDMIDRIEYSFDVMSVWRQMQNAVGSRSPVLVPTSIATANRVDNMPRIVANACYPWRIVDANMAFTQLTGYTMEEAIGSTLGLLLEGDATDISVVEAFMDDCLSHRSSSMEVTHYRKDGAPLRNFVRFFPLTPMPSAQLPMGSHPASGHGTFPCIFVVQPTSGWPIITNVGSGT